MLTEKLTEVFEQYDIKVLQVIKGRGSYICTTKEGVYSLQPFSSTLSKIECEYELLNQLKEAGFFLVDQYIRSQEQELVVQDKYHNDFVLKEHYEGKELDIRNLSQIKEGARNLANLHKKMRDVTLSLGENKEKTNPEQIFYSRNQELKRIRNYIRKVCKKGTFELTFMKHYEEFMKQGENVYEELKVKHMSSQSHMGFCHGNYNQHNVIFTKKGIATIHFEQFYYGNQMLDLYQFMRKVLEKNGYEMGVAKEILNQYQMELPLSREDYEYIYCMLSYPEKFWKLANHYYNNKKTWIPPKTIEKLNDVIAQNQKKNEFLQEFQEFYQ